MRGLGAAANYPRWRRCEMNRCLDCGAERDTDQCQACGLTSAAAEVLLRRTVVWRTSIFLVGAVIFVPASQMFPPLEEDGILIFVGVLFFLVLGLGLWMVKRASGGGEIEIIKCVYFGVLPVPWILAALLFVNGKFDADPPRSETVSVVGKFSMPGILRTERLVVTSWREGRQIERLQVSRDDYGRFKPGDSVVVQVESGVVGIPWVYAVYRP